MDITPTEHGHALCNHEPVVFHCHHYNLFLQKTILDSLDLVSDKSLLQTAGTSVGYSILQSENDPVQVGTELFSMLGFGNLTTIDNKHAVIEQSHYGAGYKARTGGKSDAPVCHFSAGFIQALVALSEGVAPGNVAVKETQCLAQGAEKCSFEVEVSDAPRQLIPRTHATGNSLKAPIDLSQANFGNINVNGVLEALATLPLAGNEEGLIPAFGVLLTRHFANYYNSISYAFLDAMYNAGVDIGREMLIEAGHICAFNTFGGIMVSPEWEAVVQPQIQNREDWIYGICAVVNALGWGQWEVRDLKQDEALTVRVHNGYETCGFSGNYHQNGASSCFLAQGGVAGLMNLLYKGDIDQKPELTPEFYESLFSGSNYYFAKETHCISKGDDYCEFVAQKV